MRFIGSSITALAVALCIVPSLARADTTMGELVYHFTYSTDQSTIARDAADNVEGINPEAGELAGGTNYINTIGRICEGGHVIIRSVAKKRSKLLPCR